MSTPDDEQNDDILRAYEQEADRDARSSGGTQLSLGILFGIVCLGWPLYQAMHQADELHLSVMCTSLSFLLMAFGLVTMIAGRHAKRWIIIETEETSYLNILISTIIGVASLSAAIAFRYYLETTFGYDF